MVRRMLTVVMPMAAAWMLVPLAALEAQAPERILPKGTQIYLRWDGMDAHREAFAKTGIGKMIQGDTGKFLSALCDWGTEIFDQTLGQHDPQAAQMVRDAATVLSGIGKKGFVIAIEVGGVFPPQAQAVLVFPGSGGKGGVISLIQKATQVGGVDVQQMKVGPRDVSHVALGPVHFGYWTEPDNDAVLMVGTMDPGEYLKAVSDEANSFVASPMYKKLTGFKEFKTWGRGCVDVPSILKKVGDLNPGVDQLIGELGLKGLGPIVMQSGFDGGAERSIVEIETTGERKGLLALVNRKTFKLSDLPPMPDDLTSFSASNFNPKNLYEGALTIAESGVKVFAPNEAIDVRELVKQVEALIGIRFGEDLFGSFADLSVSYSSPSEGGFGLSSTYLFKLKEEKKLRDILESLFKNIPPLPGAEVVFKKKDYHGGELMMLSVKTEQGEFAIANMAIHKGWFMLASYPQSIYGFILRNKGDLPTWKADARLNKALEVFPKEYVSISVSDPRPTVQFLLSLAPTGLGLANSILPQVLPGTKSFDLSLIPHAQEATRHLGPNITVGTDDGKTMRTETRSSVALQ